MWLIAFVGWWFLYLWLSVATSGHTVGKGVVGLQVIATDGSPLGAGDAARRAVAFPFSFILGLVFPPIESGRSPNTSS